MVNYNILIVGILYIILRSLFPYIYVAFALLLTVFVIYDPTLLNGRIPYITIFGLVEDIFINLGAIGTLIHGLLYYISVQMYNRMVYREIVFDNGVSAA